MRAAVHAPLLVGAALIAALLLLSSPALAQPGPNTSHMKDYAEGVYMQAFRQVRDLPEGALGTAGRSLESVEPSADGVLGVVDATGAETVRHVADTYFAALDFLDSLDAERLRGQAGDAQAVVERSAAGFTEAAESLRAGAERGASETAAHVGQAQEHAQAEATGLAGQALQQLPDVEQVHDQASATTGEAGSRAQGVREYAMRVLFHQYNTAKAASGN